jgi:hypothetical protein
LSEIETVHARQILDSRGNPTVVRAGGEQPLADQRLARRVGLGDEVGRRRLGLDLEVIARERHAQQGAGLAGGARRELEELAQAAIAGRCSGQSRARSSWAASESSSSSRSGATTSCTVSGKPSAANPAGTAAAGWPVWL